MTPVHAHSVITPDRSGPVPKSNTKEAIDFLRAHYNGRGPINLVAINPNLPKGMNIEGHTFPDWDERLIRDWIDKRQGKVNLYFSVNRPRPNARNKKLRKNDISSIIALCVDPDPRREIESQPGGFELERQRIESSIRSLCSGTLAPTTVINSGGGFQQFWKLENEFVLPDGDSRAAAVDRVETIGKRLIALAGGDSIQAIDHIMRLPGTVNLPDEDKRARGRIPRAATIWTGGDPQDAERRRSKRYTLEQLERELPQYATGKSKSGSKIPLPFEWSEILDGAGTALKARLDKLIASNRAFANRWAGGATGLKDTSRSGMDMSIISMLINQGFAAEDIARIWIQWPYGRGGEDTAKRDFEGIWNKVRKTDAAEEFAQIGGYPEGMDEPERRARYDRLLERYVYVVGIERIIDLVTNDYLTEAQFDIAESWLGQRKSQKSATNLFLKQARKFRRLTYRPGMGHTVIESGVEAFNTWRPPSLVAPAEMVSDGAINRWLEHARYLIPDDKERNHLLDWMAHLIQFPGRKINWSVLIGGDEGIGKDSLFKPLISALGRDNCRSIEMHDITAPFNGWAAKTKLVLVAEIYRGATSQQVIMERLKPLIALPPETIRINEKYLPAYDVPNLISFVLFTNHRDALKLSRSDRRYMVVWSPAQPRDQSYYRELHDFIDSNTGKIAKWLAQRNLQSFSATGVAPVTAAKEEMRQTAQAPLDAWIEEGILSSAPPFYDLVTIEELMCVLPAHIVRSHPSERVIAQILGAWGAQKLCRTDWMDRAKRNVWALRNVDSYLDLEPPAIRRAAEAQRDKARHAEAIDEMMD